MRRQLTTASFSDLSPFCLIGLFKKSSDPDAGPQLGVFWLHQTATLDRTLTTHSFPSALDYFILSKYKSDFLNEVNEVLGFSLRD